MTGERRVCFNVYIEMRHSVQHTPTHLDQYKLKVEPVGAPIHMNRVQIVCPTPQSRMEQDMTVHTKGIRAHLIDFNGVLRFCVEV